MAWRKEKPPLEVRLERSQPFRRTVLPTSTLWSRMSFTDVAEVDVWLINLSGSFNVRVLDTPFSFVCFS